MLSKMSDFVIKNQAEIRCAISKNGRHSSSSAFSWCLPFEVSQSKRNAKSSYKSLIVWPLVLISLVQVTSNLIISNHTSYQQSSAPLHQPCQDLLRAPHLVHRTDSNSIFCSFGESARRGNLKEKDYHASCTSASSEAKQCSSSVHHEGLLTSPSSAPLTYLKLIYNAIMSIVAKFEPKILLAEAKELYVASHDKEIIVLNSTNFNSELIQHDHPFPHIKLVEYYVSYCTVCLKFKHTFVQLSKDIFSWRNVIRPSAIDLSISNNSPIAESWSVEIVPLLRIHPPPNPLLATNLHKQLEVWNAKLESSMTPWSTQSFSSSDLQRTMYKEYNATRLMINTLGIIKYIADPKRGNVPEKVALFKKDLLHYIESYVRLHPDDIPATWPNLRPVTERTLIDLRRNHPRQELFLIIESGYKADHSEISLGLQIMMELSSSAPYKALRYVHASENKELIEDVIAQKRKETGDQVTDGQSTNHSSAVNEQVELLKRFLVDASVVIRDVMLIHIDDSHSPYNQDISTPSTKFPYLTVVSNSDLAITEQIITGDESGPRTKRSPSNIKKHQLVKRFSYVDELDPAKMPMNINIKLKLKSVVHYINQTYIETKEDYEFLRAMRSFDEHPTLHNLKREAVEKYQATRLDNQIELTKILERQKQHDDERQNKNSSTTLKQLFSWLNLSNKSGSPVSSAVKFDHVSRQDDYDDKLKAIRYIFFQEAPRKTLADKSLPEKLEKLNTLINLASVIKAYFPLPDLASVQFIDAIHAYLTKQKTALLMSVNNQDPVPSGGNFELRSLKQVIKNLEAEGKRLPEIRSWKHCKHSGYPCALWRLFHTLTAFEYKKLSQIYQLSTVTSQQLFTGSLSQSSQSSNSSMLQQQLTAAISEMQASTTDRNQAQANTSEPAPTPVPHAAEQRQLQKDDNPSPPVERLVSPPSTSASLSLTIATPTSSGQQTGINNQNGIKKQESEIAELPTPVLLVMRDYITSFFSCEECARNFRQEAADLSLERIRQQEPAEFSILWLWETHNRVSKRLSINPDTNPPEHPKLWYPTYDQCSKCYKKPPSYLKDTTVELAAIFHESIEWNQDEVLTFLQQEFTRQPMDIGTNIFGYTVPYGCNIIIAVGLCSLLLIVILRCASCYIERQRRHKASLLNGNGAHYSVELQNC